MKNAIINFPKEHRGEITDFLYLHSFLWVEVEQLEKNEAFFSLVIENMTDEQYSKLTNFLKEKKS